MTAITQAYRDWQADRRTRQTLLDEAAKHLQHGRPEEAASVLATAKRVEELQAEARAARFEGPASNGALLLSLTGLVLAIGVVWSLWSWFLVPLGLPQVGLLHAAGLMLCLAVVRGLKPPKDTRPALERFWGVLASVITLLILWGVAALLAWGMA